MNVKIEKIEAAEKENLKLVATEKSMRREFAADGIDASEQRQLDQIGGKIKQVKDIVAKLRKEIEENKRIWESQGRDYARLKSVIEDLRAWGDAEADVLTSGSAKIAEVIADQCWADGTEMLRKAQDSVAPVYENYLTQVAAKAEYVPLRTRFDTAIKVASEAVPQTDEIAVRTAALIGDIGPIDAATAALEFVEALQTLNTALAELEAIEELIKIVQAQKAAFDAQWFLVLPRLQLCMTCEFPDLTPMQDDILAMQQQVDAAAASHEYVTALAMATDLLVKIEAYLKAYAEAVDARTLYESRLPGILSELATALVSEFPELAPQQAEMDKVRSTMEAAAAAGQHDDALLEMDKLPPLTDAYKIAYENARLGQEFERLYAEMEPRFASAAVCNYLPIEPLSLDIANNQQAASVAASAGDYAVAIDILHRANAKLDDYAVRLAEIERAKTSYEAGLANVLARFDAIAKCEYLELDADQLDIVALREKMESSAGDGDYPLALTTLQELEKKIGVIETTLALLDAARNEYDLRLPAVISRLDGSMQSDYAELEDERLELTTMRNEMAAAAKATNYRLALTQMNAIERMLNDLDAQLGNLNKLQEQYRQLYDKIKDKIAAVEGCTHPELEIKKASILALRDEMLAGANATDFATALQKATALVAPLDEFEKLEEMLKEYNRRHETILPRLETIRGYSYKSLRDDKKAIEDLYGKMTGNANEALLKEALENMASLENMVKDLIALNEELAKNEPVYEKLRDDMNGKIEVVRNNTVEQAQSAADAVIKAHDAMTKLGEEEDFLKAIVAADNINKVLLDAYLKKVDDFGDQKQAYEILRDMALEAYGGAQKKSTEYEGLKKLFEALEAQKKAMEALATEEKYGDAKVKAKDLLAEIRKFDIKWVEFTKREATLTSEADAAIARFNDLPGDAEDKAEVEYDAAKSAMQELEKALGAKDFDEAETALSAFVEALDELDETLKTKGEHKAEYEGLVGTLEPRVEKAKTSVFKSVLTDPIEVATDALEAMKDTAANEDYAGAVKKAGDVDKALAEFDRAEDKLEQDKVRYEERWDGLKKQYAEANTVVAPALAARAAELPSLLAEAASAAKLLDYKKALDDLAKLRTEVEAILVEAERIEDQQADETDDGVIEDIGETLDNVVDYAKDKVIDKAKDYVGKKIGVVGETAVNVVEELLDGDPLDAAVELAKGAVKAHPVTDAVETAVEIADDALDAVDKIFGDDD